MKVGIVDTEEISIVVQGPIVSNKDYYPNGWTNEALKRLRRFFPNSEIILSTWKGSDVNGLDFDIVVFNDDPGSMVASPKTMRPFNVNRQIVSTISGLKKASRKYAMKMRSDTIFKDNVILSYFGKYTSRIDEWKVFKERIVTYVARNPRRYYMPEPFAISDWLHFGLREDVTSLWDIPLASEEYSTWFQFHLRPKNFKLLYDPFTTLRYNPEQYIWITFLKRFGNVPCEHIVDKNPDSIKLTEIILANNLVLLDFDMMGIEHLKFPGNKEAGTIDKYKLKEPKIKRFLEDLTQNTLSYNHYQWKVLYVKYCLNQSFFLPHLLYDVLNPLICNLYLSLKRLKHFLIT